MITERLATERWVRTRKVAGSPAEDAALEHEAEWLRRVAAVPALEGQVPRLLEEGRADGRVYLVVSVAPAFEPAGGFGRPHERFLASFARTRFRATDFEHSECGERLQRALGADGALAGAFHECESALLYWTGPYVAVQGDFSPWNVRRFGDGLFVAGWSHARAVSNPLQDLLHFHLTGAARRRAPLTVRWLLAAMARARDFAQRAYPEWAWRQRTIAALTLAYLLDMAVRGRSLAAGCIRLIERRAEWLPALPAS